MFESDKNDNSENNNNDNKSVTTMTKALASTVFNLDG